MQNTQAWQAGGFCALSNEGADRCPRARGALSLRCPPHARGPSASRASAPVRPPRAHRAQPSNEVAHPASLRAVPGAHAAAWGAQPSPPGRGASWKRSPGLQPAAAHQFPEPTMHTFRGAAAMARPNVAARTVLSWPAAHLRLFSLARSGWRRPRPVRLSANGRGHPRPAPGATADSRAGLASPLPRTTAHAWPWPASQPGSGTAPPCPRHVGTCSPHPLSPRGPRQQLPPRHVQALATEQRLPPLVPGGGCTPSSWVEQTRPSRRGAPSRSFFPTREGLPHSHLEPREAPRLTLKPTRLRAELEVPTLPCHPLPHLHTQDTAWHL